MLDLVAVDVGTSSIRAIRYGGGSPTESRRPLSILSSRPGFSEHDPAAVALAFDQVVREVASVGPAPRALVMSAHLHSLVALDADGAPTGPIQLWSDERAASEALKLRRDGLATELHERTGCPPHPSYPRERLHWMRANDSRRFSEARRFVSAKAWLLHRITGRFVEDEVTASASGLFNVRKRRFDDATLALVGIEPERLADLAPVESIVGEVPRSVSRATALHPGTVVLVGSGDGALAMTGSGADAPGILSVTVGTSAALRRVASEPPSPASVALFCYVLDSSRYFRGAASNNGAAALDWAARRWAPGLGPREALEATLRQKIETPREPSLLVLPFVRGERAPHYEAGYGIAVSDAGVTVDPLELVGATWRGVALQMALLLEEVEAACGASSQIIASGGGFRSTLFAQTVADAFDREILVPADLEASARGACLLAHAALSEPPPPTLGAQASRRIHPYPERAARFRVDLARHRGALEMMRPIWRRLVERPA